MWNWEASSVIELPFYSEWDIARLDQDSIACFLARRYNVVIQQVLSNAEEYRKLIEDVHTEWWNTEEARNMIYETNRLLHSTHTLFNIERDFGKRK